MNKILIRPAYFLHILIIGAGATKALAVESPPPVALNFRAGIGAAEGQGIAVDKNGFIYATGQFTGTGTFGAFTLTNGGGFGTFDYYIAAYSPTGQVLWAQRAGTSGADFGSDVIVDNAGDIVVVGVIQGTNDFHGVTNVTGFGNKDVFLAKYSTNGVLQWVRLAGGTNEDQCYDVAVDGENNYFIGGRISGVANFGGTSVGAASQTRNYLAKYNSNGDFVWVRDVGATSSPETAGVAADTNGNSYITGLSTSPAGPFVAKYNSIGTQQWKTVVPGNSYFDEGSGVAVDASGNVYVAGRITGTGITFGSTTLTNPSGAAMGFIAKFDPDGNALWAVKAGARAFDVFAKEDGTIYVTGFSSATSTNLATEALLPNQGGLDLYITKLDTLGNVVWLKFAGTGGNDIGRAVFRTAGDSVFAIGEGGSELFPNPNFPGGVFVVELRPVVTLPVISINLSGSDLIVSWPPSVSGYSIETTGAFGLPFQQGAVTFTPVPGQTNVYSTPKPASNLFIRLVKP